MADKPKTVADAHGPEIADRLARWAIDALVEPPEKIATFTTRIPANRIESGRKILDDMGFDWRAFKREQHAGRSGKTARRQVS